jgi:hypothetical protein
MRQDSLHPRPFPCLRRDSRPVIPAGHSPRGIKAALGAMFSLLVLAACGKQAPNEGTPADEGTNGFDDGPLDLEADREALSGRWKKARWSKSLEDKIEGLEGIGYAGGTEEASELSNVTVHNRKQVCAGLNLVVSGHAPEALLMDMEGEVLHRWRYSYASVVEDDSVGAMERGVYRDFWRRAHLFENGDLLAIFEGHALIKLDAKSNLLWTWRDRAHHDLQVDDQGHIWVLTRKASIVPRINTEEPILVDFIAELDASGRELRRISVLEAFEESEFVDALETMLSEGDILHTNTLELVDERLSDQLPGVEPGDVLISCLFTNAIAIISVESGKVVWAMRSTWKWQHQPTALDNGHILLLDNKGGRPQSGRSRVIEFDPVTGERIWAYTGTPANRFFTNTCGSCQRLPNGNTLITESDNGRALEVTRQKEVAWEFLNPFRAGKEGRLVATLFEVIRLPPDFPVDWASGGKVQAQPYKD